MANQGRILLADDEDTFLQSTADLLRDVGYDCDSANDSVSAGAFLKRNTYDLLISDINMPGNVQLEFLKEVRQEDQLLPFLVITGYPSMNTAVDSLRLAAVDYLRKPIDVEELLSLVDRATKKSRLLRSIRKTQDDMQWVINVLGHLEFYARSVQSGSDDVLSGLASDAQVQTVGDRLSSVPANVQDTIARNQIGEPQIVPGEKLEDVCSFCMSYREMLHRTIHVLTKTKDSFRSKTLGELRRQIEQVLESQ